MPVECRKIAGVSYRKRSIGIHICANVEKSLSGVEGNLEPLSCVLKHSATIWEVLLSLRPY